MKCCAGKISSPTRMVARWPVSLLRLPSNTLLRHAFIRPFSCSKYVLAEQVRIVEVGPRDGLQNEKSSIPLATKIELIHRLAMTGLQTIEAGSFVKPTAVPQMADSAKICEHLLRSPPKSPKPITYQWLLPNVKGLQTFSTVLDSVARGPKDAYSTPSSIPPSDKVLATNSSSQYANEMPPEAVPEAEIAIFTAATEIFSKKNTNCSIAESLKRFEPIFDQARDCGIKVRAYVSVALGCPYEGPDVSPQKVAQLTNDLLRLGSYEVSVADTTGMGTVPKTARLLKVLKGAGIPFEKLAFHFHDTFGQALVNTMVAFEHGIRVFDSSVAGLGGCPFSPGATGNVATEDILRLLHSLGAETGVDIEGMSEIGSWISNELGRVNESRAGKATLAKKTRDLQKARKGDFEEIGR